MCANERLEAFVYHLGSRFRGVEEGVRLREHVSDKIITNFGPMDLQFFGLEVDSVSCSSKPCGMNSRSLQSEQLTRQLHRKHARLLRIVWNILRSPDVLFAECSTVIDDMCR